MAAKTTYRVTTPAGDTVTRTSARAYTFARILDLGEHNAKENGGNGRWLVTFHASQALADRKHSDFPWASWAVTAL